MTRSQYYQTYTHGVGTHPSHHYHDKWDDILCDATNPYLNYLTSYIFSLYSVRPMPFKSFVKNPFEREDFYCPFLSLPYTGRDFLTHSYELNLRYHSAETKRRNSLHE